MNALEILEQIEQAGSGRNAKIDILRKHSNNEELRTLIRLTYDWSITFGIRSPVFKGVEGPIGMERYLDFLRLCHLYKNRDLTGDDARVALRSFMSKCFPNEQKWYSRIINRDLKIGISVKSINVAWPKFLPTFGCMLAHPYTNQKIVYPAYVEPKLDGMRILMIIKDGAGAAYSRDGLENPTLQFIADELVEVAKKHKLGNVVFDGEIFSSKWNETMHLVKKQELPKSERDKLVYHIFDVLCYEYFANGRDHAAYASRRDLLKSIDFNDTHAKHIKAKIAHTFEEIETIYEYYLEQGYEGAMVKNPGAPYEEGRKNHWLKMKPEDSMDGQIIGFYRGKDGTKYENSLGGFIVRLENGEQLRVGGGLSDAQRDKFWTERDDLNGKWIEFLAQGNDSVTKSARFGRFVRIRDDRR